MADHTEESVLEYEQLSFQELPEQLGRSEQPRQPSAAAVRVHFSRIFHFDVPKAELERIGVVKVERNRLVFNVSEKRARNKFQLILNEGFKRLKSAITERHATYVHSGSGIPLIGSNEFGVVDRGSNIIEVKPITGCNLKCVFCSVHEGKSPETMEWEDYIVEEPYLVEETRKIAALKKNPVEINIGPQGEPTLYPQIVDLVRDMKEISNVKVISMNTNGVLLTNSLIDRLADAGLTRINLSIHALDQELAQKLMGAPYSIQHMLDVITYAKTKMAVLLAPVMVPGMNEGEMGKLIELSKGIQSPFPSIGIQSFLNYKHGRNPVKAQPIEGFFEKLKDMEQEHKVSLLLKTSENPFQIYAEPTLPKPFRKDDIVQARIMCRGRHPGEMVAVARERTITVMECDRQVGSDVMVKIVRDKHNIFKGIATKGRERIRKEAIEKGKINAVIKKRKKEELFYQIEQYEDSA